MHLQIKNIQASGTPCPSSSCGGMFRRSDIRFLFFSCVFTCPFRLWNIPWVSHIMPPRIAEANVRLYCRISSRRPKHLQDLFREAQFLLEMLSPKDGFSPDSLLLLQNVHGEAPEKTRWGEQIPIQAHF
jgi:hypothetical protein